MKKVSEVRVDKWLWSVRIYKTRSMATEACKKGKVIINNVQVKPSRILQGGEIIEVKKPPVVYTYEVLELLNNRVSAKLVEQFMKDITPQEEKDKLEIMKEGSFIYRHKGLGRPTKKERRDIDRFRDME